MKKPLVSLLTIFFVLIFFSSTAFPWGSATHAYIANKIGKKLGLKNLNEIYGSMAPDMFNYAFDIVEPLKSYLRGYTHGIPPSNEDFMDVWYQARWWGYEKALAYGHVAHNDVWGADLIAHWHSLNLDPNKGYIIIKAEILKAGLQNYLLLNYGFTLPDEVAMEFAHNLMEAAGDVIIKRVDNEIGNRIIYSSLLRSPMLISLLARSIGEGYRDLITSVEREFRKTMIIYGAAFIPDDENEIIELLSAQMAELAKAFLAAQTPPIVLPPGLEAQLDLLISEFMIQSILLIQGDYMLEVEDTINHIKAQLWSRWIFYF